MKRMLFALPLLLCACGEIDLPDVQPEDNAPIAEEYTKKFCFTVKGDFTNPDFCGGDDADTMIVPVAADGVIDEWGKSQRRANQYMTADGNEMTDMWIIDYKDGAIQQSLHQTASDADWGAPTMSLTLGTHHILFLASRGQGSNYADGVVTWTKPMDTFYLDYEVTVAKTSNGNRSVTLNRVATRFSLLVDDAIADGTTTVTITPAKWYTGWNMLTAQPVVAQDYSLLFNIPASYNGVSGTSFGMWGLSAADEWTTDVAIVSKAGSDVNASATIEGAPFKANRVTKYSGMLYSNASESSVSLNAEWLPEYEGVY